jgi:tetratricopeptide (TPR) repeat protein
MNLRHMSVRVLNPVFCLALLLCPYGRSQQAPRGSDVVDQPASVTANASNAFKQELLRRIALAESIVRRAESAHLGNAELSKAYLQLGLLYQDAAQLGRSEEALKRAVSLLRQSPSPGEDQAAALAQLGSLHVAMWKLRESEKECLEALEIRKKLGDPLHLAQSRINLAVLYLAKQKYEKAKDLARQAEAELITNQRAEVVERIEARLTLAEAMCYLKDCPSAIPLLRAALDDARSTLQPEDFPVGMSNFLLGYAYWKSGDMSRAEEYLRRGTALMNTQLGWGHPTYVSALRQYAQFLHENREPESASVIERRIRQAEAVVDVHSIQTSNGMFGLR